MSGPGEPRVSIERQPLALLHRSCFVCGADNPFGLRALFTDEGDGCVSAHLRCDDRWSGYAGALHGGIVTSLLDGAMVHCLFTRQIAAVTSRLSIRFHGPVYPDLLLTVSGRLISSKHRVHELEAELTQLGSTRATATAQFVAVHGLDQGPQAWCCDARNQRLPSGNSASAKAR